MRTTIVYYSKHHGNTKRLLDAIAATEKVTLIDVTEHPDADLASFDRIGFASGNHRIALDAAQDSAGIARSNPHISAVTAVLDGHQAASGVAEAYNPSQKTLVGGLLQDGRLTGIGIDGDLRRVGAILYRTGDK